MNSLGLPYTNIMTRSAASPSLGWCGCWHHRGLVTMCLVSVSSPGGCHCVAGLLVMFMAGVRTGPWLPGCAGSPSPHISTHARGSPGGLQGGTSQCRGQADTRLRRRTSAQERYLTPAPAECGGGRAGPGGPRTPHS